MPEKNVYIPVEKKTKHKKTPPAAIRNGIEVLAGQQETCGAGQTQVKLISIER
jgi:hypothetical protein